MKIGTQIMEAADGSLVLIKDNAPLFLTIASVGFGIGSTVLAIKVTPEAYDIYKKIMDDPELTEKQKKVEVFKRVIPLYGPSAFLEVMSAGSGIFSYSIHKKRLDRAYETIATLVPACAFASDGLRRYQKEIKERYGEEAHQEIKQSIEEKKRKEAEEADEHPENVNRTFKIGLHTKAWFKDNITGRTYYTTMDQIYRACREIERRLVIESNISSEEYYIDVDGDYEYCSEAEASGWLANDTLDVKIDDENPKINAKLDIVYYDVFIDTNPNYAAYMQINRC